jgi:uncharacterized protein (DUF58 family)
VIARPRYAPHRRAHYPRLWPVLVPSAPVAAALSVVLGAWPGVVASAALGAVVMHTRWVIWRRRHPVISPEEYAHDLIAAQRRAAPWN